MPLARQLVYFAVLLVMITSEAEAIAKHQTTDQRQARKSQVSQKQTIEQELLETQPGQHVIFVNYAGLPSPP
jgi:hypothetical protein